MAAALALRRRRPGRLGRGRACSCVAGPLLSPTGAARARVQLRRRAAAVAGAGGAARAGASLGQRRCRLGRIGTCGRPAQRRWPGAAEMAAALAPRCRRPGRLGRAGARAGASLGQRRCRLGRIGTCGRPVRRRWPGAAEITTVPSQRCRWFRATVPSGRRRIAT
jgi:hypothetical protein